MKDQYKSKKQLISEMKILRKTLADQPNRQSDKNSEYPVLQESALKYHILFDNANDAIFLMKGEIFTDCNQKTLEMFGCERNEIVGHSPMEFSPAYQPDGKDSVGKALTKIQSALEGKPQLFEWKHQKLNGTLFDAEVSLKKVILHNGTSLLAIVRDISDRKLAEAGLKKANEIINRSPVVVFIWNNDPDWRIEYCSENVLGLTGYSQQELMNGNLTYRQIIYRRDLPKIISDVKRSGKDKKINHFTHGPYRILTKDGKIKWVDDRTNIIRNSRGKVISFEGIVLDITDKKNVEIALQESENKYRTLFEKSADAILMIKDNLFVDCNKATIQLLGYKDKTQFLSTHPSELSPEFQEDGRSSYEKANEMMSIAVRDGSHRFEWLHKKNNGEIFPVEVLLTSIPFGREKVLHVVWRDITARKVEEANLRQKEFIIHSSNTVIATADLDGLMTYVNPVFLSLWEIDSVEKIYGRHFTEFWDLTDLQDEVLNTLFKDRGKLQGELKGIRGDGSRFDILVSAAAVSDGFGNPIALMSTSIDITKRKKIESDLTESKRMLNDVLNTIPARVFWKDIHGRFLGCNQKFAEDAGRNSPEDLIGEDDYKMGWADQAELYRKDDREVIQSKIPKINYHEPQTTPSGEQIWLNTSKIPLRNDAGEIYGILGTYNNITEQKLLDEALKISEKNYRLLVNTIPYGIQVSDQKGKITFCNPALYKIFGSHNNGLIGTFIWDHIPNEIEKNNVRKQYLGLIDNTVDPGIIYYNVTTADNKLIDVQINWAYIRDQQGNIESIISIISDITERKQTQRMLIQSEKMLSVGGLAAGMAHEINNPLAGIMQTVEVMLKRLGNQTGSQANDQAARAADTSMDSIWKFMEARGITRMLHSVHDSGRRIARIVENMLSFARKSDQQFKIHDINEILESSLELASADFDMKKEYDFKRIGIEKEFQSDLPHIPCDRSMLQQVFFNILRNSAESLQNPIQKKRVIIVRTFLELDNELITIEIQDNGPGMEEEIRRRVFEPFFTTKPVGIGTGLGLSVSYFIITENHGGQLSVQSKPEEGAKFIIKLPVPGASA